MLLWSEHDCLQAVYNTHLFLSSQVVAMAVAAGASVASISSGASDALDSDMMCEECWSDDGSAFSGLASCCSDPGMCDACGVHPKHRGQKVCTYCFPKVKSMDRNATKQGEGQWEAFKAVRKAGGEILKQAMEEYDSQTLKFGRGHLRPDYDHIGYNQKIQLSSNVDAGSYMIWMTVHRFAHHCQMEHGWK